MFPSPPCATGSSFSARAMTMTAGVTAGSNSIAGSSESPGLSTSRASNPQRSQALQFTRRPSLARRSHASLPSGVRLNGAEADTPPESLRPTSRPCSGWQVALNHFTTPGEPFVSAYPQDMRTGIRCLASTVEHWPCAMNALNDRPLKLLSNIAERELWLFVCNMTNWLFGDAPAGAHASAAICSISATPNQQPGSRALHGVAARAHVQHRRSDRRGRERLPTMVSRRLPIPVGSPPRTPKEQRRWQTSPSSTLIRTWKTASWKAT